MIGHKILVKKFSTVFENRSETVTLYVARFTVPLVGQNLFR